MLNKIFISFADGCLLFDEIEQSVLILNQTAAFIWCASFEERSRDDLVVLVARTFSISAELARHDIEQFYDDLQTGCLFLPKEYEQGSFLKAIDKTSYLPCDDSVEALYFLVNQNVFQLVLPTMALRTELSRIYYHFICSADDFSQATKKFTIEVCLNTKSTTSLFSIYIDQQCVTKDLFIAGVVPYVFGIVFESIWTSEVCASEFGSPEIGAHTKEKTAQSLIFHAAVLAQDSGGAILFPAESGAGKCTLAALLAAKGWHFFSDELAVIKPQIFAVSPCPFPVCVKDGAVEFLSAYYPQLSSLTQHHRLDDKKVRYLPVDKPVLNFTSKAEISAIIFPCYNKEINCELQHLDKTEALTRFLNCGSSGRPLLADELLSLAIMIEKLPCYSLTFFDTDRAIEQIESVIMSL